MRSVAIIPARGGSKRIPGKNIRDFCGKPIIAYPIETALHSGIFERVIVSTDSPEIANIAKRFGAEVSNLRPEELSTDHVSLLDVMKFEAMNVRADDQEIEAICFLIATSPFVTAEALREGGRLLDVGSWDYVIASSESPAPVELSYVETETGGTKMFFPGKYGVRSNDLKKAYFDAGQFYWGRIEHWIDPNPGFHGERTTMVKIPRHLAQDIDQPEDWDFAEKLFQINQEMGESD